MPARGMRPIAATAAPAKYPPREGSPTDGTLRKVLTRKARRIDQREKNLPLVNAAATALAALVGAHSFTRVTR